MEDEYKMQEDEKSKRGTEPMRCMEYCHIDGILENIINCPEFLNESLEIILLSCIVHFESCLVEPLVLSKIEKVGNLAYKLLSNNWKLRV